MTQASSLCPGKTLPNNMSNRTLASLQMGRGIAALMVVFVHLPVAPLYKVWPSGVDFFFVLSGFIIYYVHHSDFGKPTKIGPYLYRRFIRIYPIYWLVIGSYMLMHYLAGHHLKDFYQANTWGIVQTIALFHHHPLVVLTSWTLAYEVFFYLSISFRFIFKHPGIFYIFFLLPILSLFKLYPLAVAGVYYSSFLLEALLGIITFEFYRKKNLRIEVMYFVLFLGIIFTGVLPYILETDRFITRGLPAGLVLFALVGWEKHKKIRIPAVFMHLGNASYLLYLSHPIVLSTLHPLFLFIGSAALVKGLLAMIAILVAIAGHYLVEKPLLSFLRQ